MMTAFWRRSSSFSAIAAVKIPCFRQNLSRVPRIKPSLLLLLQPPSFYRDVANANNNGRRGRRRRRPGVGIGSLKITKTSLKKAATFAMSLRDPLNLFLLHFGGLGGGGGGLDLPGGGSDSEWFGKRRREKIKGLVELLVLSIALASGISGVYNGKRPDWELGIRVLVPAALGFKATVWRHYLFGLPMILGLAFAFYALLRRRESRRPW